MSENWALEVSWATDLSPTTHLLVPGLASDVRRVAWGGEEVYPGWGYGWVVVGGLYRVPHPAIPVPIFSHIPASKPYPGPNEGNSQVFYEVS